MTNEDDLLLKMEYLFQFSNDEKIKLDYLNVLIKNTTFNKKVFHFLENAFLTEDSELLKVESFKIMHRFFPSKLDELSLYALKHEEDDVVIDLLNILEKINVFYCRFYMESKLRNENAPLSIKRGKRKRLTYNNMKEAYFRRHLEKKLETLYFHRHEFPLASDLYGI